MSRILKMTIAYSGARYAGWQRQARGTSIQGLLEDAIARIEGQPVTVAGAGRTDAGVHALAQVASVRVERALEPSAWQRALNGSLPPEVRILAVEHADPDFHALRSASLKTYVYRVTRGAIQSPFEAPYSWHIPQQLNIEAMRRALGIVRGRHDFAAFRAAGSNVRHTVRTITHADLLLRPGGWGLGPGDWGLGAGDWGPGTGDWGLGTGDWGVGHGGSSLERPVPGSRNATEPADIAGSDSPPNRASRPERSRSSQTPVPSPQPLLVFTFVADGFLRHMVRNLMGTIIEIGRGRWNAEAIRAMLDSRDRSRAGPTAPAHALFLIGVDYGHQKLDSRSNDLHRNPIT